MDRRFDKLIRTSALSASLLAVYAMYMQLNDARASKETRRGLAHSVLPPEVYAWMYPQGTSWDAPIMGEARATAAIPSADVYSIRHVADTAPPANEQGRYPLRLAPRTLRTFQHPGVSLVSSPVVAVPLQQRNYNANTDTDTA